MLNPLHLRSLVRVLELGSIAQSARELGYTASAISQHISALERRVGVTLFERSAKSISPTPAAEYLAERARVALSGLNGLEEEVKEVAEGALGGIRIGSFPTASEHLLPRALAELLSERPNIDVFLDEGEAHELGERLWDGDLDLAVVYNYELVPRRWPEPLHVQHLFYEALALLLPEGHWSLDQPEITLAMLRDERWLSTQEATPGAEALMRLSAVGGFLPNVVVRSNDYDVIRGLVSAGMGIALVPALADLPQVGVVSRKAVDVTSRRVVSLLYRSPQARPLLSIAIRKLNESAEVLISARNGGLRRPDPVIRRRSLPGRAAGVPSS